MISKDALGGGRYIKLESRDWKGDARGFLAAIKKLKSVCYAPAELDEPNFWFIGKPDISAMEEAYDKHIKKVLQTIEEDRSSGYKPLPRGGGRFARRLRY
jgi:hypothetical protein